MKKGVESLGRVRAQGIILLLVTFVVGSLAGVSLERIRATRSAPQPFGRGPDMMRPWAKGVLPPMFDQLNLTSEQEIQIRQIMEASRPRTEAVMRDMLPRVRAVMDSVRQEIDAVLTTEQAAQLDSMEAQMHGRWPMRRGRRGPPGGGVGPFRPQG